MVAEVLLEVTGDAGRGVGRERAPAARLEPSYRLDQRQQGHLLEVVHLDAPAPVAVRDPQRHALVEQHDLVEQPLPGDRGPGRRRPLEQALGADLVGLATRSEPLVLRDGFRRRVDTPDLEGFVHGRRERWGLVRRLDRLDGRGRCRAF